MFEPALFSGELKISDTDRHGPLGHGHALGVRSIFSWPVTFHKRENLTNHLKVAICITQLPGVMVAVAL